MKKLLLPIFLMFASLHGERQAISVDGLRDMWNHRTEHAGALRVTLEVLSQKAKYFDELVVMSKLDLSNSYITDLAPLAGLKNLKSLDLSGTFVADISALAALENLESLNLANTMVADITALYNLKNLTYVDLFNSNVQEEQLKGLKYVHNMRLKSDKNLEQPPYSVFRGIFKRVGQREVQVFSCMWPSCCGGSHEQWLKSHCMRLECDGTVECSKVQNNDNNS